MRKAINRLSAIVTSLKLTFKKRAVNSNFFKQIQLPSINNLLTWLLLVWALGALGLGWVVKSLLIVFGVLAIAPIIFIAGAQWWVNRNLIRESCPSCGFEVAALNNTELNCPSCGEALKIANGQVIRPAPQGTIDVSVVEVVSTVVEDE